MPIAVRISIGLLALLFATFAFLISDSIVYPWGGPLGVIVALCGLIVSLVCFSTGHRWAAALFAVIGMAAIWQIAMPWADKHAVLAHASPADIGLERHFVVGYDDAATVRQLVRDAHIGGIFLTRRNVEGRTAASVAAEIAGLQDIRHKAGLPPLVVAADQEGGPVSHLSPPLPSPPALSTLAALPADERQAAAKQLGVKQGSALKGLGVTMDLAPVCDLTPASPPDILDWHTRIATRSISANPTVTATIAASFSQGLLAAGITPTAKHFPGLDRVKQDTHLFGASLDTPEAELQANDWRPFRAVLSVPGAALMLSHVALDSLDVGTPASRSKRIVAGLLRQQWGFNGIAITDDLTMGAIERTGLCRAVEGALNAGVDLLLVSWDTDKVYPALRCALDALDAGRLDQNVLRQSAERLDRLQTRDNRASVTAQ